MKLGAYLRLMRFHKPVGILLLWIPTAWALWIANHGNPPISLMVYFLLGTIVMRAAGCIANDIADRDIDLHVKRTKKRPLTAGEVNLVEALLLLVVLLFAALITVLQLPTACFYDAVVALGITIIYPFCKRFLQAPQLVLGLAFSMGIPMAYAASGVSPDAAMFMIFILNFAWIVAYDTMYAMADREDDLRIGVKSTAILFGQYDRMMIMLLQLFFHTIWLYLAVTLQYSASFYGCWLAALIVLIYQQLLIRSREADACLSAFTASTLYGLIMWGGLVVQMLD